MLAFRAPPDLTAEVEAWAKRQPDSPSRSEAIRRLVQVALAAQGKQRRP
jgi:metal-responsive CopG/Arc/MetJ family transcriptional regulator